MKLEVVVCTFNERITKVEALLLEPREDVEYLISFQYTDDSFLSFVPSVLHERNDVRVITVKGNGLAANRNNALRYAMGDILLIADDDNTYKNEYFNRIINTFTEHKEVDIATFRIVTQDGNFYKNYPSFSFLYQEQPKGMWFSSVEIALRRSSNLPDFDERFGIGAPYLSSGEEEVFLWQAYKKGLNIRYFPETVVCTESGTTGSRIFTDIRVQRSKGAVLCLMHGPTSAWLRCLKYAMMNSAKVNPFRLMKHFGEGIRYIESSI